MLDGSPGCEFVLALPHCGMVGQIILCCCATSEYLWLLKQRSIGHSFEEKKHRLSVFKSC